VIEPDVSAISNLNRYMLLLQSRLAQRLNHGLRIEPIDKRYEPDLLKTIAPLAGAVLVGVDDIPTRWAIQRANPQSRLKAR
jgi:hypothetical protein